MFRGFRAYHAVLARKAKLFQVLVDAYAGPGIGGSIQLLCLGQGVGLPVGQALALGNLFLKKECMIQALFFDAERGHVVLQLHPVAHARVFLVAAAQHGEIIFQRQADFEHVVLKELFQEVRQPEVVQAEQEAGSVSADQEGHLVDGSLPERRACFGVHPHQYMGIEVITRLEAPASV